MRTVYLIRHGTVWNPSDPRTCIGVSDLPLSGKGKRQTALLADWFSDVRLNAVYASPLCRSFDTACAIGARTGVPVTVREDLAEMRAGLWENMSFAEIERRFPEEYRKRGEALGTYPMPGGESFFEAGLRFQACMDQILAETEGDIAVVSHGGVIRAYLCLLENRSTDHVMKIPQPHGGITLLCGEDRMTCVSAGRKPESFLDEAEIQDMYERFGTPAHVQAHMKAAAAYAVSLCAQLNGKETSCETHTEELTALSAPAGRYDAERLRKAALVHDIARTQKNHAETAADYLAREGWPRIADLVRAHHSKDPVTGEILKEADLLFYADKRFDGERFVSVQERFAKSRKKCTAPEALANWNTLYEKTLRIEEMLAAAKKKEKQE